MGPSAHVMAVSLQKQGVWAHMLTERMLQDEGRDGVMLPEAGDPRDHQHTPRRWEVGLAQVPHTCSGGSSPVDF